MSQNLVFTFKKDNSEFVGGWLSTTPSRRLSKFFPYTETDVELSTEELVHAILEIGKMVEETKTELKEQQDKYHYVFDLSINSKEVYDSVLDTIDNYLNIKEEYQKELADLEYWKSILIQINRLIDDNPYWKLTYINA